MQDKRLEIEKAKARDQHCCDEQRKKNPDPIVSECSQSGETKDQEIGQRTIGSGRHSRKGSIDAPQDG